MREFKESEDFIFMCDKAFSESFGLFMSERFTAELFKLFKNFGYSPKFVGINREEKDIFSLIKIRVTLVV